MPRVGRIAPLFLVAVLVSSTWAQVAIPRFGTRGDVPPTLVEEFAIALRAGVRDVGGLDVAEADLITPGIAGSLDPESAVFIAELEGVRFAVSGEIARVGPEGTPEPFRINLIVLDAREGRSTDLINRPLRPEGTAEIAREIAEVIVNFTRPEPALPRGNSVLFISSQPSEADIFVNGSSVGKTSEAGILMLAPGRYEIELRKEGFLLETRTVELHDSDTRFVHVVLSPISGGIIQVDAEPEANVLLDGQPQGVTPVAFPALPGDHTVSLTRGGFYTKRVPLSVRNYRVTRLEERLEPATNPLVFWHASPGTLVFFDDVLQSDGFVTDLTGGLVVIEIRRGGVVLRDIREVPASGAFELDLETGELIPYVH